MKAIIDTKKGNRFNTYMSCLAIEITRRCDMNCKFCFKGRAQNLDISKEIIDKTLDEMQNTFISLLRISGGEPFLAPDMVEYLIDKIIEKHIYIDEVCIFTNGKHRVLKLIEPFNRLINYLCDIESDIRPYIRWGMNTHAHRYAGTLHSKISVVISDIAHDIEPKEVKKTIDFYTYKINNEMFSIVGQIDTYNDLHDLPFLALEGNALTNYKELLKSPLYLNSIRMVNNSYYFMGESANLSTEPFLKDMKFIQKTLSIAPNGNVFPGCSMSHDRVDIEHMFNILGCQNDFIEKVTNFCWMYPINEKTRNMKEKFAAIEWCRAHNLEINDMSNKDYELMKNINLIISAYEQIARDMHSMLPTLSYPEIEGITTATTVLQMFNNGMPKDFIKMFLDYCTDFDGYTKSIISPDWCRGFILHIEEIDRERRKNLI